MKDQLLSTTTNIRATTEAHTPQGESLLFERNKLTLPDRVEAPRRTIGIKAGYSTGTNARMVRELTLEERDDLEHKRDLSNYATRKLPRPEKTREESADEEEEPERDASYRLM